MSFIIYFVVLVVTSLSVLFGLDILTAPLPTMPNVPIGRQAHLATIKPETAAAKRADARALTPIYPAAPGGENAKTATTGAGAASPMAPSRRDSAPAAAAQPADRAYAQKGATQQVAQPVQNKCDVQACAIAYHSFRAVDCTYRPFQGPRQRCDKAVAASVALATKTKPPAAEPANAPAAAPLALHTQAAPSNGGDEASPEVASIVREFGPYAHDVQVQNADGRVVTVHVDNARDQAPCDIAVCAAAYSSFDAVDCTYRPYGGPRQLCTK